MSENTRPLEETIHTDLSSSLSYGDYLGLESLLNAQQTRSPHHDEMLFIIQHQTSELWMKLIIHELKETLERIRQDDLSTVFKILARIGHIQWQLFQQWSVLETLTPPEYLKFRGYLEQASGFQSHQYRVIEFLLGNKNAAMSKVFQHHENLSQVVQDALESPSIYDEFLRYLARNGYDLPTEVIERDWTRPYASNPAVLEVFRQIYGNPEDHWNAYAMCEKLVDVEERFQLWRFRHLMTVKRVIGHRTGTGGSSGVGFLQRALDLVFYPELWEVRTGLEEGPVVCPVGGGSGPAAPPPPGCPVHGGSND